MSPGSGTLHEDANLIVFLGLAVALAASLAIWTASADQATHDQAKREDTSGLQALSVRLEAEPEECPAPDEPGQAYGARIDVTDLGAWTLSHGNDSILRPANYTFDHENRVLTVPSTLDEAPTEVYELAVEDQTPRLLVSTCTQSHGLGLIQDGEVGAHISLFTTDPSGRLTAFHTFMDCEIAYESPYTEGHAVFHALHLEEKDQGSVRYLGEEGCPHATFQYEHLGTWTVERSASAIDEG